MSLNKLKKSVKSFVNDCKKKKVDIKSCLNKLENIKVELLDFDLLPPFDESDKELIQVLELARDVLERATLLSIQAKDADAFLRYIDQIKVYYYDYSSILSQSELQWPIIGLKLMSLLVANDLSEFHVEMELIPIQTRTTNSYIRFVIELEQELMEGSYKKIFSASKQVPMPEYSFFMNSLTATVREKIASCMETAYVTMEIEDASRLLMADSLEDVQQIVKERQWTLNNTTINFPQANDGHLDIPAMQLIGQTLQYACEMERII